MNIREATAHLPSGLHDAHIECIAHDAVNARVTVELRIPLEPNYLVERRGRLVLEGVHFWYVDPPSADWVPTKPVHSGLMMDDCGGRPSTCNHEWPAVPADCFENTFYINTWNTFIHTAARSARFEWTEDATRRPQ